MKPSYFIDWSDRRDVWQRTERGGGLFIVKIAGNGEAGSAFVYREVRIVCCVRDKVMGKVRVLAGTEESQRQTEYDEETGT